MATSDRLVPLLEAALKSSPLLLDDVSVTAAGRRSVVRVVVDRRLDPREARDEVDSTEPTDPLSLDEVADATRLVGEALDESDVMGQAPYTLEVSSPGVTRPLTAPRHFRRNVGRLVKAIGAGVDSTGRLVRAGAHEFVLDLPATKKGAGGEVTLRYDDISRGEVQIEFNRADSAEVPDSLDSNDSDDDGNDRDDDRSDSSHDSSDLTEEN